jgi:cytosine/creatinine deaminase
MLSAIEPGTDGGRINDLVLQSVTLHDGRLVDICIQDGRIAAIEAGITHSGLRAIDMQGRVVLPGFVDAHTHLDKALTLSQARNNSGTLLEAIEVMGALQQGFTRQAVLERAREMAHKFVAAGTTALRTHVDVKPGLGVAGVEALLELRDELRPILDLQLVVLATTITGARGAATRELVKAALAMGVDVVGGCPIIDGDPTAHIDAVFELAERYGVPIDLHVDESDSAADFCLPYLAERTKVLGYQGRVIAGHCCSLAAVGHNDARRTIEAVREAGITIVTLPSANMYLQGRGDTGMVRRGLTRVRELMAAGVPVCCGSDNVQDPFNPFGRGDPLQIANLFAHLAHLGSPVEQAQAIDAITSVPAAALGISDYGLHAGAWADLVVLETTSPSTLLAEVPVRRYVFKRGSIVAETRVEQMVMSTAPLRAY